MRFIDTILRVAKQQFNYDTFVNDWREIMSDICNQIESGKE